MVLPYINMHPPQVYTHSPSWTPLLPPSPYHPSGSSQCTSPEHPVSSIKPGLVIRFTYDIIHLSMLFSQIIPPLPSPTESKRLFYTSVSLLLSRIQGHHYHPSKFHIYVLLYCFQDTGIQANYYGHKLPPLLGPDRASFRPGVGFWWTSRNWVGISVWVGGG